MPVGEPAQHHHHSHSSEKLRKDHGYYYFPGLPNAAPARVIPKDARYSYYVRSRSSTRGIATESAEVNNGDGEASPPKGREPEEGERTILPREQDRLRDVTSHQRLVRKKLDPYNGANHVSTWSKGRPRALCLAETPTLPTVVLTLRRLPMKQAVNAYVTRYSTGREPVTVPVSLELRLVRQLR